MNTAAEDLERTSYISTYIDFEMNIANQFIDFQSLLITLTRT